MYHIAKTKSKKFQVVLVGKNGEPLSTTEILNSKQAAFKNIARQVDSIDNCFNYAQDDTSKNIIVYRVFYDGRREVANGHKVKPKYTPGKNPKRITPKKNK